MSDDAREFYVANPDVTYADVAEKFGIPVSTLQKRGARERWPDKRRERQELDASYKMKVKRVKARLLDDLLQGSGPIDPQRVHAWRSLETAFPEHRYAKELDDGRRNQIVAVLVDELVDELETNAPSALKEIAPLLETIAKRWLAADWDRR